MRLALRTSFLLVLCCVDSLSKLFPIYTIQGMVLVNQWFPARFPQPRAALVMLWVRLEPQDTSTKVTPGLQNEQRRTKGALGSQIAGARLDFTDTTRSVLYLSLRAGLWINPSSNAGVALDLACGLGRHALWLASRQWRVSGVDLSDVAIGKLSRAALELNVNLDLLVRRRRRVQI